MENLAIYGVRSLVFSLVVGFLLAALLDRRAERAAAREEAALASYDDGELPSDPDPEREDQSDAVRP